MSAQEKRRRRAAAILTRLKEVYPGAKCALNYETPLQLLVATMLSAQCTDERVNQVTRTLFQKYRTAADFASAPREKLEEDIRPTGYYRSKAQRVQAACRKLVEDFAGEVPASMEELLTLPGVARKTANVVLGTAFGQATGIVVDTHVKRLAQRMGLSTESNPDRIERDLMALIPQKDWIPAGHLLITHGRRVCTAHRPQCDPCPVADLCPRVGVQD